MKKFFNLLFTAMTTCAVVSMTSCSSDDDDPNISPDKEEVSVYQAILTPSYLDYYDIKLTVTSGNKQKEVTLTKADGKPSENEGYAVLHYVFDRVDDAHGVTSVIPTATPKANIEEMLSALDPDTDIPFFIGSKTVKTEFSLSGNYLYESSNFNSSGKPKPHTPAALLGDYKGEKGYNTLLIIIKNNLTFD